MQRPDFVADAQRVRQARQQATQPRERMIGELRVVLLGLGEIALQWRAETWIVRI